MEYLLDDDKKKKPVSDIPQEWSLDTDFDDPPAQVTAQTPQEWDLNTDFDKKPQAPKQPVPKSLPKPKPTQISKAPQSKSPAYPTKARDGNTYLPADREVSRTEYYQALKSKAQSPDPKEKEVYSKSLSEYQRELDKEAESRFSPDRTVGIKGKKWVSQPDAPALVQEQSYFNKEGKRIVPQFKMLDSNGVEAVREGTGWRVGDKAYNEKGEAPDGSKLSMEAFDSEGNKAVSVADKANAVYTIDVTPFKDKKGTELRKAVVKSAFQLAGFNEEESDLGTEALAKSVGEDQIYISYESNTPIDDIYEASDLVKNGEQYLIDYTDRDATALKFAVLARIAKANKQSDPNAPDPTPEYVAELAGKTKEFFTKYNEEEKAKLQKELEALGEDRSGFIAGSLDLLRGAMDAFSSFGKLFTGRTTEDLAKTLGFDDKYGSELKDELPFTQDPTKPQASTPIRDALQMLVHLEQAKNKSASSDIQGQLSAKPNASWLNYVIPQLGAVNLGGAIIKATTGQENYVQKGITDLSNSEAGKYIPSSRSVGNLGATTASMFALGATGYGSVLIPSAILLKSHLDLEQADPAKYWTNMGIASASIVLGQVASKLPSVTQGMVSNAQASASQVGIAIVQQGATVGLNKEDYLRKDGSWDVGKIINETVLNVAGTGFDVFNAIPKSPKVVDGMNFRVVTDTGEGMMILRNPDTGLMQAYPVTDTQFKKLSEANPSVKFVDRTMTKAEKDNLMLMYSPNLRESFAKFAFGTETSLDKFNKKTGDYDVRDGQIFAIPPEDPKDVIVQRILNLPDGDFENRSYLALQSIENEQGIKLSLQDFRGDKDSALTLKSLIQGGEITVNDDKSISLTQKGRVQLAKYNLAKDNLVKNQTEMMSKYGSEDRSGYSPFEAIKKDNPDNKFFDQYSGDKDFTLTPRDLSAMGEQERLAVTASLATGRAEFNPTLGIVRNVNTKIKEGVTETPVTTEAPVTQKVSSPTKVPATSKDAPLELGKLKASDFTPYDKSKLKNEVAVMEPNGTAEIWTKKDGVYHNGKGRILPESRLVNHLEKDGWTIYNPVKIKGTSDGVKTTNPVEPTTTAIKAPVNDVVIEGETSQTTSQQTKVEGVGAGEGLTSDEAKAYREKNNIQEAPTNFKERKGFVDLTLEKNIFYEMAGQENPDIKKIAKDYGKSEEEIASIYTKELAKFKSTPVDESVIPVNLQKIVEEVESRSKAVKKGFGKIITGEDIENASKKLGISIKEVVEGYDQAKQMSKEANQGFLSKSVGKLDSLATKVKDWFRGDTHFLAFAKDPQTVAKNELAYVGKGKVQVDNRTTIDMADWSGDKFAQSKEDPTRFYVNGSTMDKIRQANLGFLPRYDIGGFTDTKVMGERLAQKLATNFPELKDFSDTLLKAIKNEEAFDIVVVDSDRHDYTTVLGNSAHEVIHKQLMKMAKGRFLWNDAWEEDKPWRTPQGQQMERLMANSLYKNTVGDRNIQSHEILAMGSNVDSLSMLGVKKPEHIEVYANTYIDILESLQKQYGSDVNRILDFYADPKTKEIIDGYKSTRLGTNKEGLANSSNEGKGVSKIRSEGENFSKLTERQKALVNEKGLEFTNAYAEKAGIKVPEIRLVLDPLPESMIKEASDLYESLPHSPQDRAVKESYSALLKETADQYKVIADSGIKIEKWTGNGEPYKGSKDMIADIVDNNHYYYLPTDTNFGSGDKVSDHPMLTDSGIKNSNGESMPNNDVFRIVHDLMGHLPNEFQFGIKGETNAFVAHSELYSEKALPALMAETLMQNSVVATKNYKLEGGKYKLNVEPDKIQFADQKAIIPPKEFVNKVTKEIANQQGSVAKAGKAQLEEGSGTKTLTLLRMTKSGDPTEINGFGGAELFQRKNSGAEPVLNFFVKSGGDYLYEPDFKNRTDLKRTEFTNTFKLYDTSQDPTNYYREYGYKQFQQKLQEEGYDGFYAGHPDIPDWQKQRVSLFDTPSNRQKILNPLEAKASHYSPHRFKPEVEVKNSDGTTEFVEKGQENGREILREFPKGRFRQPEEIRHTGEGATVYGDGLYFFTNEEVGRYYKEKFTRQVQENSKPIIKIKDSVVDIDNAHPAVKNVVNSLGTRFDKDDLVKYVESKIKSITYLAQPLEEGIPKIDSLFKEYVEDDSVKQNSSLDRYSNIRNNYTPKLDLESALDIPYSDDTKGLFVSINKGENLFFFNDEATFARDEYRRSKNPDPAIQKRLDELANIKSPEEYNNMFYDSTHTVKDRWNNEEIGTYPTLKEAKKAQVDFYKQQQIKDLNQMYEDRTALEEFAKSDLSVESPFKIVVDGKEYDKSTIKDSSLPEQVSLVIYNNPNKKELMVAVNHLKEVYRGVKEDPTGVVAKHLKDLEDFDFSKVEYREPKASRYNVELTPEDHEWLLWDEPISEQEYLSKQVKDLADSYRKRADEAESGGENLPPYAKEFGKKNADRNRRIADILSPKEENDIRSGEQLMKDLWAEVGKADASKILLEAGIKGNKFLDGSSRNKGKGTYNYVVFNSRDIDIQEVAVRSMRGNDLEDPEFAVKQSRLDVSAPALQSGDFDAWVDLASRLTKDTLTEAEVKKIKELSDAKDIEGLHKYTADLTKMGIAELFTSIIKVNPLLGVKTLSRNVMSNLGFSAMEEISRVPASVVDMALSFGFKKDRSVQGISPYSYLKGLLKGSTVGAKEGLKTIVTGSDQTQTDNPYYARERTTDNILLKPFEIYTKYGFRLQEAIDKPAKISAETRAIDEAVYLKSKNEGISRSEARANLTVEDVGRALEYSKFATFQNDNAIADKFYRFKENRTALIKAMIDLTIPYIKTPTNVLGRVLDYSGILPVMKAVESEAGRKILTADWNGFKEEMAKAIDNPEARRAISFGVSRGMIGWSMAVMGYYLAKAGYLQATYDEKDRKDNALDMMRGISKGSVLYKGTSYDISSLNPVAFFLLSGADTYKNETDAINKKISKGEELDESKDRPNVKGFPTNLFNIESLKKMALMMPLIGKAYEAVKDSEDGKIDYSRFVGAGRAVPAIIGEFAQTRDPNTKLLGGDGTQSSKMKDQIKEKIPYLRETLPNKVDMLGRPIPTSSGFDPFRTKSIDQDKLSKELDKFNITFGKFEGTPKQQNDQRTKYGTAIESKLQSVVNTSLYDSMGDKAKKKALEGTIRYFNRDEKDIDTEIGDKQDSFNYDMIIRRESDIENILKTVKMEKYSDINPKDWERYLTKIYATRFFASKRRSIEEATANYKDFISNPEKWIDEYYKKGKTLSMTREERAKLPKKRARSRRDVERDKKIASTTPLPSLGGIDRGRESRNIEDKR